jgi:predicted signal transduction protein with EAL and GGDEF domain
MNVVAEGIETLDQSNGLRDLGCEYGQGFFFSAPVKQEEATQLLRKEWGPGNVTPGAQDGYVSEVDLLGVALSM